MAKKQNKRPGQALSGPVHLGDLGKAKAKVDITFGWFGVQIRANPGAGELELVEFLTAADQIQVGDDPQKMTNSVDAMRITLDFLRRQIHPDDWAIFFDLAKTNRQDVNDLLEVAMQIVERVAGVPTSPPSGSPAGRRRTGPKSSEGSFSPVTSRALELTAGRPDLQMAYVRAAEAGAVRG